MEYKIEYCCGKMQDIIENNIVGAYASGPDKAFFLVLNDKTSVNIQFCPFCGAKITVLTKI